MIQNTVAEMLHQQSMPPEEIRAILKADDRQIVRRYLELHRERLVERLEEQQRMLDALERSLMEEG